MNLFFLMFYIYFFSSQIKLKVQFRNKEVETPYCGHPPSDRELVARGFAAYGEGFIVRQCGDIVDGGDFYQHLVGDGSGELVQAVEAHPVANADVPEQEKKK